MIWYLTEKAVDIAAVCTTWATGFRFPAVTRECFYPRASLSVVGPTRLPVLVGTGSCFPEE
jgi:hypothetical protein